MTKRKRKPRVRLYSSEALDLSGLSAKHHDYARLFVHRLISRRIFDRRLRGREYIAMDSRIIRQYIPVRHVKPVLDYLVETGQVERTGYSEGHSTRYRLSDELHRSRCMTYPPKASSIARKLWREKEEQHEQANTRKRPVHHHLDLWLKRVRVDEKAAVRFISDQQKMMLSWLDEHKLSWFSELPFVTEQLAEDRLHAEASIQAIVLKDMYHLPCDYGRYHTNISSLHRILRPFLRIDGQSLIEVDVSACQPLCLSVLLHDIRNNVLTSVTQTEEHEQLAHQLSLFPICCASGKEDDVNRYQKDCETRVFYERMQEICKVASKPELKQKLFAEVFFGKRKSGELLSGFRRLYPTMGQLIDWVKSHDYRHLAHTLQRIESSIVIDDACEVMRVQHAEVPILTIHDALLTVHEHTELVEGVLRAAFNRRGVNPMIETKDTPRNG